MTLSFPSWLPCLRTTSTAVRRVPRRPCPTASPARTPVQNPCTTSPTWSTRTPAEERLKSARPSSKQVGHFLFKSTSAKPLCDEGNRCCFYSKLKRNSINAFTSFIKARTCIRVDVEVYDCMYGADGSPTYCVKRHLCENR